jgi:hypothetical protein
MPQWVVVLNQAGGLHPNSREAGVEAPGSSGSNGGKPAVLKCLGELDKPAVLGPPLAVWLF